MRASAALDLTLADVVPVELAIEGRVDVAHQPQRDRCDRVVCSPMTRLATPADVDLVRRRADAVVDVVCLAVLLAGMAMVSDGRVPGWKGDLFQAVNDLPGAVSSAVAVPAARRGRRRLAVAALLGTLIKLALERVVVQAVVSRQRPAASIGPGIHLRGDVPVSGEGFVSGHAVMVAALASIVALWLPERWRIAPWVALGGVGTTRVYVGAHSPLDVLCGAAIGPAIGGGVNLLVGVPEPSR